jgi:predicted patatin/cPLA2 family phospholipase
MKIGLIVEGGGMKCAYSAGILDRFLDDNITFDYVSGVSAGSANAASFLAGQKGRNRRFYTDHIDNPEFFGIKSLIHTGNLFNLHHIYSTLTNSDGTDPLDYDAIAENPAEYVISATDACTGKPAYFDGHSMPRDDYRIIMASSALPAVCHPVRLDNGRLYFDGGVSDAIPADKALLDGCDKVVIISSKPRDFVKKPEGMKALYSLLLIRYPAIKRDIDNRHIMYKKCQDRMFELEREGRAFLFCPSRHLPMGTYAMDKEANQKLYDLGIGDYDAMRASLKAFMTTPVCEIS